jgi:membrane-associated HD superfamily phosphohydrolase
MRPNFEEMTSAELRAYALAHRDDVEPLRVLYSRRSPDSEATWYGPMSTPEGVPIEENIRIAEEAIRQRAEKDREKQREKELQKERELEERLRQKIKQEVQERLRREIEQERVSSGKDNMTTVTQAEIQLFREQLRDYPDAIGALEIIEQRNGNIETAAKILAIRAGYEPSRKFSLLDELSEKSRKVICQEEFREDLAAGVIVAVVEPLATSAGIPPGLATAIAIYAFKTGVKKFCQPTDSES